MKVHMQTRSDAILLLSCAASNEYMYLYEATEFLGLSSGVESLALQAVSGVIWSASSLWPSPIGFNWRETRAEAAQRLREGWQP